MEVVISGYFIWIHKGHIDLIEKAVQLCTGGIIVILNNDEQQKLKYGRIIVPFIERKRVLESIKGIREVVKSIDKDRTVCKTLARIHPNIFANGGDRNKKEIPEAKVCKDLGIKMVDGLGKKIQSASKLIKILEK